MFENWKTKHLFPGLNAMDLFRVLKFWKTFCEYGIFTFIEACVLEMRLWTQGSDPVSDLDNKPQFTQKHQLVTLA